MSLKPGEVENLIRTKNLPKIEIKKHKLWDNPDTIHNDQTDTNLPGALIEIDPKDIHKWEFKDRPENELGDLDELAKSIKTVGQLQPGIVRLSKDSSFKYELIIGERRWKACIIAGLLFQAKLTALNNSEASIAQAIENKDREKLSDYARGMNYTKQIIAGNLKQSDLTEKLGVSRQNISRLLSYREIPTPLIEAIEDMTKVSPRTAEEIKLLCKKDSAAINILISVADKIRNGIGHTTVRKYYEKRKSSHTDPISNLKVFSKEGRHLYTWRKDGNGNLSISFPKDIRSILEIKNIENDLITCIEKQLKLTLSPQGDNFGK